SVLRLPSVFSTTRCPAFRPFITDTVMPLRNALHWRCGPSTFLRSRRNARRRLSLFVLQRPDKLHLATRIGWPADKRVFLPRFRVAAISRGASRRRRNDRKPSVSVLDASRRSTRAQRAVLSCKLAQ